MYVSALSLMGIAHKMLIVYVCICIWVRILKNVQLGPDMG